MQKRHSGFALRFNHDEAPASFFDVNGIGDWSLAADAFEAEIFETREQAQEAIDDNNLTDAEIVAIDRFVSVSIIQDVGL